VNCDDVLASLESGGPIRRYFARRHVAKCLGCTAVAQQFFTIKGELGQAVQVQPKDRLVWRQAAANEVEVTRQWSFAMPQLAAIASLTAALVLGATVVLWQRSTQQPDQPEFVAQISDVVPVISVPAYSSIELTEMGTGLERIADDLARLERAASLLEARRQARALAAAYDQSRSTADVPAPRNTGPT
jgi:hypothetical protein